MKHSLLTCFLLMTAVTLQIAAAQDTINQSSQVNFWEQIGIVGTIINEDGSPSVATFYYGEYEGIRGFYSDGICLNR